MKSVLTLAMLLGGLTPRRLILFRPFGSAC